MTKQTPLTRTCAACGIEKPLSAFLYLSSKHGTTYGSICATCRSAGAREKASTAIEDEQSSTSSSMRIGAKQRVEMELQQKLAVQERSYQEEKELKKREHLSQKIDSAEQKEQAGKFQREKYLNAAKQKQSFLNYQTKTSPLSAQSILGQKEQLASGAPAQDEKQRALEAEQFAEAEKQEQRNTTLDLSGSPIFDQQHNMISRDNPNFRRFQAWLGADAPIVKAVSQLYKTGQKPKKQENPKETPQEFIEKTWGPSRKR